MSLTPNERAYSMDSSFEIKNTAAKGGFLETSYAQIHKFESHDSCGY